MTKKIFETQLNRLLNKTFQAFKDGAAPPHKENQIFTNRSLELAYIEAIGFDMDHTLIQYDRDALDRLTMTLAAETMVDRFGYPESIREIPFEAAFAIRGLVIDTRLGNVLKMDKFHFANLAYHGLKPLDDGERAKLYSRDYIAFNTGRYRSVDSLFDLLEVYLYAAIVDRLEAAGARDIDYAKLYADLRASIDLRHSDDSLKRCIMAEPERFINRDPLLFHALHRFKNNGKQLFILTNSEPHYTEFALDFAFQEAQPLFRDWRECFGLVCAAAGKPRFFSAKGAPQIIEDGACLFCSGGGVDFLDKRLRVQGDRVLYVGDHIYGDILKSKHGAAWRTCFIAPELTDQVRAEGRAKGHLSALAENEAHRNELAMEVNWLEGQCRDIEKFARDRRGDLKKRHARAIDERLEQLGQRLEDSRRKLGAVLDQSRDLCRQIDQLFNPYWGRLFKTGSQPSMFAEQIRDYACIYTSAVNNFAYYGDKTYLESTALPMPHEEALHVLGDLDFDGSLDAAEDDRSGRERMSKRQTHGATSNPKKD